MDLIDRADVHDLIAKRLSDYLTDESRNELEELDIKVEEDIPPVQAVPIEVLDKIRAEIDKWHHLTDKAFNDGIDTALEIIDKYKAESDDSNANQHNSNALNALEGDAISRQAVTEIINDIRDCISVEGYCAILERLKKLPSVNPASNISIQITERENYGRFN